VQRLETEAGLSGLTGSTRIRPRTLRMHPYANGWGLCEGVGKVGIFRRGLGRGWLHLLSAKQQKRLSTDVYKAGTFRGRGCSSKCQMSLGTYVHGNARPDEVMLREGKNFAARRFNFDRQVGYLHGRLIDLEKSEVDSEAKIPSDGSQRCGEEFVKHQYPSCCTLPSTR